ncbi:MAG TPA: hypothetical protein VNS80_07515, partial [Pseudolysinimonas sp.]|nr:hypothetical protein [Pseudolysinimonas sp.]
MTTYQEPPLQSRRAIRQGERVDQSAPPFAPPQTPRTAAGAGEPLSYVTQNRPPLPGYDAALQRGRRSSTPEPEAALPEPEAAFPEPQAALPEPENAPEPETALPEPQAPQSFRPRDFSPEARTAPPAWAPDYDRDNGVLDHHTQVRATPIPQTGHSLAAALGSEPSEQTLTRRELRAIRESHAMAAAQTDALPEVTGPAGYSQPAPAVPQQFAPP